MPEIPVGHGGATLDAWSSGAGELLLVIRTALTAQHLVPLTSRPALTDHVRVITYDRRGYGRSAPASEGASLRREAEDAVEVLGAFCDRAAHVLGDSFSAAIALELALTAPAQVRSLILIEPPPNLAPGAEAFRAASQELLRVYAHDGPEAALESFMQAFEGPNWREDNDRRVPGMSERIQRDARTFFAADIPALLEWEIDPVRAAGITCPVLYIAGSESGPLFAGVHDWLLDLLPHAQVLVIQGAGHGVSSTHPDEVAAAVADFVSPSHPPPDA